LFGSGEAELVPGGKMLPKEVIDEVKPVWWRNIIILTFQFLVEGGKRLE